MTKPEDYFGPMELKVPIGFIDVTTLNETRRHGIPDLEHPYYALKDRIEKVLLENGVHSDSLLDDIMGEL